MDDKRTSALGRLKQSQQKRSLSKQSSLKDGDGMSDKFAASSSHVLNDKYMELFEAGFEELQKLHVGERIPAQRASTAASSAPSHRVQRPARQPAIARRAMGAVDGQTADFAGPPIAQGFWSGPTDTAGSKLEVSERPVMCGSVDWAANEAVLGSSDHALYVVDIATCTLKRTLFTKSCGHQEWVTCVAHTPTGRVLSGGMDNKLCLWEARTTRCQDLTGHSAPVSALGITADGTAVSCSYDKSVRVWDVGGGRGRELCTLQGHAAPVLSLACGPQGQAVTGDRGGSAIMWDTAAEGLSWKLKDVHKGHVTALAWLGHTAEGQGAEAAGAGAPVFCSGGQDGHLRVWDPRGKGGVVDSALHVGPKGKGAVSSISCGADGSVVTAGADGTLRILDPAVSWQQRASIALTDFPYSLLVVGGLALCGCGDGLLHVVDVALGRTLYALGVNAAAVRTVHAAGARLVCSGDDGSVLIHEFAG